MAADVIANDWLSRYIISHAGQWLSARCSVRVSSALVEETVVTITAQRPRATQTRVSAKQVRSFQNTGYLVVRQLLSGDEVGEIAETFMRQNIDGPVAGLSEIRSGDRGYSESDPLRFYPRMMNPHKHSDKAVGPVALKYLLDTRIRVILEAICGEQHVAAQSMFYFKPPGARGQDLHQDNFYLRVAPGTCVAAWIAVDDADSENGGMVVVPKTQDLEIACPEKADPGVFFTSDHVAPPPGLHEEPVTLKAGDCLFFNGSVIHGSYPNTSNDRFRKAIIFHYVPEHSNEMSTWYDSLRFDGTRVEIPPAVGGGPCGTPVPMGAH